MERERLAIGLSLAFLVVAALVACPRSKPPERIPRAVGPAAPRAARVVGPLPVSTRPIPPQPDEITCPDPSEETDRDAAIEAALLTLIRARGRGTDARR